MKNLLITLMLALIASFGFSQRGLEAGAVIQPQTYTLISSSVNAEKARKIPYSFAIGVDLGYNLTDRLGLRTGILYSPVGERYNDITTDPEERVDLNLNYIQAPLYLKFNTNPDNRYSFLFLGGGYIGLLNDAIRTVNEGETEGVIGDYKRIVPGVAAGVGVQMNLDRGGNLNFLIRSNMSLDVVEADPIIGSRNFATGLQLSYHYFIWEPGY